MQENKQTQIDYKNFERREYSDIEQWKTGWENEIVTIHQCITTIPTYANHVEI